MILALAVLSSRADTSVLESRKYNDPNLGLTVVGGTLELPGETKGQSFSPSNNELGCGRAIRRYGQVKGNTTRLLRRYYKHDPHSEWRW
jgi:hypothetical protein